MTEGSGSVLGANTIRGHDVYFDIPNSSRIGFAPSDCDYNGLINDDEDEDEEVSVNYKEAEEEEQYDDDDEYYIGGGGDDNAGGSVPGIGMGGGTGPSDDDDYYEDENNENNSFSLDLGKITSKAKESNVFAILASVVLVGVVGGVLVTLAKRLRRTQTYSPTAADLNDLHLDTEVERLPAIA